MAGQLKNLQTHVSKTLQDVMQALGGEDYAFYNFEIKGIAETERAKIQMAIKVLVPQSQRTTAAKKIKDALHRTRNTVVQDRAGTQLNVNIPNTPSGKVQYIRLDIKPIGTGRGSAATAVNECGQALYAEYAFNKIKGKIDITKPISKEDLKEVYDGKNVDVSFEDIMGLDGEWRESSILGANELWERFGKGKTYHFYRGGGLDDKEIKKAFAKIKKGTKFTSEDKWNPSDIWMASSDFNPADITSAAKSGLVRNLNQFLIERYDDKTLMGISLKKMTGEAKFGEINLTKDKSAIEAKDNGYLVTYKTGNRSPSKDVSIKFGTGTHKVIVYRTFGGDKSASWNGEVGGASAAQGKISGPMTIEIVRRFNPQYKFPTNQQLWSESGGTPKQIEVLSKKIYLLLKKFDAKGLPATEFDAVSDIVAQSRGYRYSKYYGLLLVDAIQGISDVNKKNECVKDLYLYASSQHVDSGFHIKLQ